MGDGFCRERFLEGREGGLLATGRRERFPLSLLERFGVDEEGRLIALLRFIRELSTPRGYVADQGIVRPERFLKMMAPGFGDFKR